MSITLWLKDKAKTGIALLALAFLLWGIGSFVHVMASAAVGPMPTPYTTPMRTPAPFHPDEGRLMSLVQSWRAEVKKPIYDYSSKLCEVTQIRAVEVQTHYSHDGFKKWLPQLDYFDHLGENLSQGYDSEEKILAAWLASPGHRENLEDNNRYSCMRCEGVYCVNMFAR
jgi:hypothetical protein